MECRLVIGSENVVELSGFRDRLTSAYPTTAAVTLALADALGAPVTGATAIALTLVGGTSGVLTRYRGTILHTVVLTPQTYVGTVTADVSGNRRVFTIACPAVTA
jgi:hypothetical protein